MTIKPRNTQCPVCQAEGITEAALSDRQIDALNVQINNTGMVAILCKTCEESFVRRPLKVSWQPKLRVLH